MANTAAETASAKAHREARELVHARLRTVMGTKDGRAVMWHVLVDLGYLFSQSDAGELTHTSARNAGRRDVALELLEELKAASPELHRQLLVENLGLELPRT